MAFFQCCWHSCTRYCVLRVWFKIVQDRYVEDVLSCSDVVLDDFKKCALEKVMEE